MGFLKRGTTPSVKELLEMPQRGWQAREQTLTNLRGNEGSNQLIFAI